MSNWSEFEEIGKRVAAAGMVVGADDEAGGDGLSSAKFEIEGRAAYAEAVAKGLVFSPSTVTQVDNCTDELSRLKAEHAALLAAAANKEKPLTQKSPAAIAMSGKIPRSASIIGCGMVEFH
jgi:hypothetical protein